MRSPLRDNFNNTYIQSNISENDSISNLFQNDSNINPSLNESIIYNNEYEEIANNENITLSNQFIQNEKNENSTGLSHDANFVHKKRGRKKKGEESVSESHNKYSNDNMTRKTKHLVCKSLLNFFNHKIFDLYKGKIGHGSNKKKFILGKHSQISNGNIESNKQFLQKTLKEIFSVELSANVKNYQKDHNQKLIEILINEDDIEKREYFKGLFNLNFLYCLKYYRSVGDDNEYLYIKGSKRFIDLENDAKFRKKYEDDYINLLREFMEDYEKNLEKRKGRRSRLKSDKNNKNQIKDVI